jgi:thymidylate synthase (FAD)
MSTVELIWATPDGDNLVARMARVSNPSNEDNTATAPRLLKYLIDHKHWSPFEMVNACVLIECPRDISRQILRHRSFSFQEFSGRYAEYETLIERREPRLSDATNRQNSLHTTDENTIRGWERLTSLVRDTCYDAYKSALDSGVAKEVARVLLPEGLVPTRMYMNGTLRSWIHYWDVRCGPETQKEHRDIAIRSKEIILANFPQITGALNATS